MSFILKPRKIVLFMFFKDTTTILDCISQGTIQLFHQQTEHHSRNTNNSQAAALLEPLSVPSPK